MANLIYEDQSAKALRLNLVKGAVDKKLLNVLCTGKVELPYGKVEVGIIGASHYFEFTTPDGNVALTEVFACMELKDVKNHEFYGDIYDASSIRKPIGNLIYDFKVKCFNWEQAQEKFEELFDAVQSNSNQYQIGLQFVFPCTEKYNFMPVTLIYLITDPETLTVSVKTLHAYPNEDSLVFTETILSKK